MDCLHLNKLKSHAVLTLSDLWRRCSASARARSRSPSFPDNGRKLSSDRAVAAAWRSLDKDPKPAIMRLEKFAGLFDPNSHLEFLRPLRRTIDGSPRRAAINSAQTPPASPLRMPCMGHKSVQVDSADVHGPETTRVVTAACHIGLPIPPKLRQRQRRGANDALRRSSALSTKDNIHYCRPARSHTPQRQSLCCRPI
jgi:hypothetical protein